MGPTYRSFTGFELSESDSLYKRFEFDYEESEMRRLSKFDTKRMSAGGRFKLRFRDRLLTFYSTTGSTRPPPSLTSSSILTRATSSGTRSIPSRW